MPAPTTLTICLWFDGKAQQAADFYATVFPDLTINATSHYGPNMPEPEGTVLTVEFSIGDQQFLALNAGPQFTFNESISFQIPCADQQEVDHYWDLLTADGGQESQCGWLKDKFGVSWQVVPTRLTELMKDPNPARAGAAAQAMMRMGKIVIADLESAADAAG